MNPKTIITAVLPLLLGFCIAAQAQEKVELEGQVLEAGTENLPLDYAVVSVLPAELHTVTDAEGRFLFQDLPGGAKIRIQVQYVGYKTIDTLVTLSSTRVNRYVFRMETENFFMDEVVVTAKANEAGEATASEINRQAIDHLQASSLKDIMQLVPGAVMSNSNLNNPNMLSIRSIDNDPLNSMGTALILDGAQQSNNANLQMTSATANGSTNSPLYYQDASAGNSAAGVDTRTISLDNVESVEVIRGIPSAEYGDLTSGAVIVKSKVGQTPLNVKFSARPEQYQGSLAKGLKLGEKGGTLNLNADFLYTIKRPIESYWNYRRLTAGGIWAMRWSDNFDTRTSLNVHYGLDRRTANPDNAASQLQESGRDLGFKFNHTGNINVNKGWLKSIEYGATFNYTDRLSEKSEIASSASGIYSTNMVSGSIVSNWPGQSIYDNEGNEITNLLPGTEDAFLDNLSDTRLVKTSIYGKEIYANARVKLTLYKDWNNGIRNKIIAGADFKSDGNLGKGKVYDNETAPSPGNSFSSERIRHYYDIPFMNQFSLYAEDLYKQTFGRNEFVLSAGVRYDNINGKNIVAPRANASITLFDRVTVRGGYGITAKAPSLVYLYPENAYFDMPLYSSGYKSDPAEELYIVKTNIYSAENPDLKIATNNKAEAGVDIRLWDDRRLSLTAYLEKMQNGYSLIRTLNTFHLVDLPRYTVVKENAGSLPELKLEGTYKAWQSYYVPSNTAVRNKKGLEFELDLGRFDAIRTSFNLSGAWMRESYSDNSYSFSENIRPGENGSLDRNIGVYEPNRIVSYRERLVTTLRITHNIPKIGFVVTLTSQLTALDKSWSTYSTDMFTKYISRIDGKVYDFDPAMADDEEFYYLFDPVIPENREWPEKAIPTLFFNLTLTKEIGDAMRISFFANNMFYNRPIYNSTKNRKTLIELGNDIFFGFDITFNIR